MESCNTKKLSRSKWHRKVELVMVVNVALNAIGCAAKNQKLVDATAKVTEAEQTSHTNIHAPLEIRDAQ